MGVVQPHFRTYRNKRGALSDVDSDEDNDILLAFYRAVFDDEDNSDDDMPLSSGQTSSTFCNTTCNICRVEKVVIV